MAIVSDVACATSPNSNTSSCGAVSDSDSLIVAVIVWQWQGDSYFDDGSYGAVCLNSTTTNYGTVDDSYVVATVIVREG